MRKQLGTTNLVSAMNGGEERQEEQNRDTGLHLRGISRSTTVEPAMPECPDHRQAMEQQGSL